VLAVKQFLGELAEIINFIFICLWPVTWNKHIFVWSLKSNVQSMTDF